MKKLLCLILSLVFVFSLCACDSTVEDLTVEDLIEKNQLEALLGQFDSVAMTYTQYDADDKVTSSGDYYYTKDNYGYLYFNALMTSYGQQELKSYYTATNGALYSYVSGITELSVFENKLKGCEDYIENSIDHFDLDFEDEVKSDGDYYKLTALKITETYYMHLRQEAVYYFDIDDYSLQKIEMDATDKDGEFKYYAEVVFKYNTEAPTDTADKYFAKPAEGDSVGEYKIVFNPGTENESTQTYSALKSSLIRGATINGVQYSVYKDAACENQISAFSDLDEKANTVYIIPTPEEETTSSSTQG